MHHMQLSGTQLPQCGMPRQLAAPTHIIAPCPGVSSHCQAQCPASHPQPHSLVCRPQQSQCLGGSSIGLKLSTIFCQQCCLKPNFPSRHALSKLAFLGPTNITDRKHSPQQAESVQMIALEGKVTQTQEQEISNMHRILF